MFKTKTADIIDVNALHAFFSINSFDQSLVRKRIKENDSWKIDLFKKFFMKLTYQIFAEAASLAGFFKKKQFLKFWEKFP